MAVIVKVSGLKEQRDELCDICIGDKRKINKLSSKWKCTLYGGHEKGNQWIY